MAGPIADPTGAPHAVRHVQGFGADTLCERCHQLAPPPFSGLERPLPDTHGEHRAWQALTERTERCVDCHMPAVVRPAAIGGAPRPGRRHTFPGAWDADFLRGAVRIVAAEREGEELVITVRNETGHAIPTADPARAVRVGASAWQGDTLLDRQHQLIARRVPLPRLRDEGDEVLAPAETRTVRVRLSGSALASADRVVAEVSLDALAFPPPGVAPSQSGRVNVNWLDRQPID